MQLGLFVFWGKKLRTFTLALAQSITCDKMVQESEKIVRFLHHLSCSFVLLVAIVSVYCLYPHTTMKSAFLLPAPPPLPERWTPLRQIVT